MCRVCFIHSLFVQKTGLFISCCFSHDCFFTGNGMFWLELCAPPAGLAPPARLAGVTRVVRPWGPHAWGQRGCRDAGEESPFPMLGGPERKKSPRGSPLENQELLGGLGPIVRELSSLCWFAGYCSPAPCCWEALGFSDPFL